MNPGIHDSGALSALYGCGVSMQPWQEGELCRERVDNPPPCGVQQAWLSSRCHGSWSICGTLFGNQCLCVPAPGSQPGRHVVDRQWVFRKILEDSHRRGKPPVTGTMAGSSVKEKVLLHASSLSLWGNLVLSSFYFRRSSQKEKV